MENLSDETHPIWRSQLVIRPNSPVELGAGEEAQYSGSDEDRERIQRVSASLRAYRTALKGLLAGKYSAVREVAPVHMTDACCMMAFVFADGILVRYDTKTTPDQKGFVGMLDHGTLASMAPQLSASLVHCPSDSEGFDPGDHYVTLTLSAHPVGTSKGSDFAKLRLYVVARGGKASEPAVLPAPLVSVVNEFKLQLFGEMLPEDARPSTPFVMVSKFRLPLGWQAIEIYPPLGSEVWNADMAGVWAERDLLAAIARRNLGEAQFQNIDPNAGARKQKIQLLADFASLLGGPEEPLHQFIRNCPQIVSPTFARVWSKLRLGPRVTDFVVRESTGDYVLVELESPRLPLFRKDGQPSAEFTHAVDQTTDWKRYLEDNRSYAQNELGLEGISVDPRRLIVMCRSTTMTEDNRRKLVTMENDRPRLRIMTYDDLLASAQATFENILGPTRGLMQRCTFCHPGSRCRTSL